MQQILEFAHNHPILSMAWVGCLIAIIVTTFQSLTAKFRMITPAELTLQVNRADGQVLDIRAIDDFRKGHIAGAKNVPAADLANQLTNLENYKDKPIIVVCYAGMTAQKAATQLLAAGFAQVSVLTGGMQKWADDKLPVVRK